MYFILKLQKSLYPAFKGRLTWAQGTMHITSDESILVTTLRCGLLPNYFGRLFEQNHAVVGLLRT